MRNDKLRIELAVPNFFFIPTRRMEIESVPETGRTYFIDGGRIVAVGKRGGADEGRRPELPARGADGGSAVDDR